MARSIDKKHDALVVEGPDDRAFVNALFSKTRSLSLHWGREGLVKEKGGADEAFKAFDKLRGEALPGVRIGLIVDRDGIEGRDDNWPKVQSRIPSAPVEPNAEGFIFSDAATGARLGLWMWPDCGSLGDLEFLLGRLLPPLPAWSWAREATTAARVTHGAEFQAADQRKAELKVRSAWLDKPQGGYGHLVTKLDLTDDPAAQAFLTWFERLYLTE